MLKPVWMPEVAVWFLKEAKYEADQAIKVSHNPFFPSNFWTHWPVSFKFLKESRISNIAVHPKAF